MIFLIFVGALMAGYGTAYVASDDVRYLTRAGAEETRILQSRQTIADGVRDPGTKPVLPRQLLCNAPRLGRTRFRAGRSRPLGPRRAAGARGAAASVVPDRPARRAAD